MKIQALFNRFIKIQATGQRIKNLAINFNSLKSYRAKKYIVALKINKFMKKKNFRQKIFTIILKILVINSFTGKVLWGDQGKDYLIKRKIRNIKIKDPNQKIETFELNVNVANNNKNFLTKEDIENFAKINRETIKKMEQEEKEQADANQKTQDEIKKKAEAEAKALEAKKKQEEEDAKPWVLKKALELKTFFNPNQIFYNSIKFGFSLPQNNQFSAGETNANKVYKDLFTGTDSIGMMPFFAISAGFDAERIFRYELELSYFLFAGSPKNIQNSAAYSNMSFDVNKNVLNFSLLNISLNGFLKFQLPNLYFDILQKTEVFFGGGVGIGYAIPKSGLLQSALVIPTFQAIAGLTIPINTRFKANIYWKMIFADIKFQNQNAFPELSGNLASNRAISSGTFHLQDFTAHFICFDVMWTY